MESVIGRSVCVQKALNTNEAKASIGKFEMLLVYLPMPKRKRSLWLPNEIACNIMVLGGDEMGGKKN